MIINHLALVKTDTIISELERRHIVEQLDQLMAELEQSTEISQGAIDGVVEIYKILGVTYGED